MSLTIAVPTFNRPGPLVRTVAALLPQMDDGVRLLVLDNCSPVPAAEVLAPLLANWPRARVEVRRHPVNIGGNANVVRCFELCDTDWL